MKSRVLVLATNESTMDAMYNYLGKFFKEYVILHKGLIGRITQDEEDTYDLLIMPNPPNVRTDKRYINNPKTIACHRVFDYKTMEEMFTLEPNENVYLVSDNEHAALKAAAQLKEMGVLYFNIIPYYPGCKIDTDIKYAISPGESQYTPEHIKNVIDLGSRVPSVGDVSEIAKYLDLPITIINSVTEEYLKNFATIVSNSNNHLRKLYSTQQVLNNVIHNIDQGVCLVNKLGRIKMVNRKFTDMLCLSNNIIIGSCLQDNLIDRGLSIDIDEILRESIVVENVSGRKILIDSYEIHGFSEDSYLIYANNIDILDKKQNMIRLKTKDMQLIKKYYFDDYITKDNNTIEMINRAKLISTNHASVLIQGESGTGKEILAQAIHYQSPRKHHPFVPVNFAAIQPNLLDSELFGYVDGSFTGASKGGSKGLFEMAHKGTIFFDEIGDAPLEFQVRLLRVLQEKEIRKIGSSERIPVDIRVIAATNKNLADLVREGRFREDLYYRINVMPIDTIPLRDRKQDIMMIFDYFIRESFNDSDHNLKDLCSNDVIEFLMNYEFRGNVRELRNIVEYFSCIKGANAIGMKDLPRYMFSRGKLSKHEVTEIEISILRIIDVVPKIGRGKISDILKSEYKDITQGKVRTILKSLADKNLIIVNSTRGGCEITILGKEIICNN